MFNLKVSWVRYLTPDRLATEVETQSPQKGRQRPTSLLYSYLIASLHLEPFWEALAAPSQHTSIASFSSF